MMRQASTVQQRAALRGEVALASLNIPHIAGYARGYLSQYAGRWRS